MALAEAGYPDQRVQWWPDDLHDDGQLSNAPRVPDEVWWRALAVGDPCGLACWQCWSEGTPAAEAACDHDPLTSPWPEVVR